MWLKIFYPVDLAIEYRFSPALNLLDPWVVSAIVIVLLALFVIYRFILIEPIISFGLFWFLLFQIPTSNFFWPLSYFGADRYMYAPLAGFFMALSIIIVKCASKKESVLWVGIVPVLVCFGILTWEQTKVWQNQLALHANAVKVSPNSSKAISGLSMEYYMRDEYERAIELSMQALKLNPNQTDAIYVLGLANEQMGDVNKAILYFKIFIETDKNIHRKFIKEARRKLLYYQRGGIPK